MFGDQIIFYRSPEGEGSQQADFDPMDAVREAASSAQSEVDSRHGVSETEVEVASEASPAQATQEAPGTPAPPAGAAGDDGAGGSPDAAPAPVDAAAEKPPEHAEKGEKGTSPAEGTQEPQDAPQATLEAATFTFEGWDGDVDKLPEKMRETAKGVAAHFEAKVENVTAQLDEVRKLNDILLTGDARQIVEQANQRIEQANTQISNYQKLVDTLEAKVFDYEAVGMRENYPDFFDENLKLPNGTTVMDATLKLAEDLGHIDFEHTAHLVRMGSESIDLARALFKQYPGVDPKDIVDLVAHRTGKSYNQPVLAQKEEKTPPQAKPQEETPPTTSTPPEAKATPQETRKPRQTKARRGVSGASSDIRSSGPERPSLTPSRRASDLADQAAELAFRNAS